MNKRKRWKAGSKILAGIISVVVLCVAAFLIYSGVYYKTTVSVEEAGEEYGNIKLVQEQKRIRIDPEAASEKGLIFYPGAKVEYTAYASLLYVLAEQGYTCFMIEMPFNFAFFNINAAADVIADNPEISEWYLAGHSLGGAMAASYAADHADQLTGLILLAAYGTKDFSASDLAVVSIWGSEDRVINREKMTAADINLPEDARMVELEGGNHAQFGTYGQQKGDGDAKMTPEQQRQKTAAAIIDLMEER